MNITEQLTPVNHDTGRGGHSITGIVLHTMVGWLQPSIDAAHNPSREMSMNYCVGLNGQIVRVVRESDTAWCNANYLSNQTTISIEHEDGGDYNGPRTPELYEASAELVADICSRYGIPCDRDHIKGHREVIDKKAYPGGTACPDALDMDRIVARASQILNEGNDPAPAPASAPASGAITVGSTVRPTRAVSYENISLAPFVLDRDYPVTEVRGDRAVLGNGLNTAFHTSDLQLVGQAAQATPVPVAASHPYTIEDIAPRQLVADTERTEWDLDQTTWPGISGNPAGKLEAGKVITAVAIAHHQLGSSYYMEERSTPKGYNTADLHDYVAPAPAATPEPTPASPAPEYPEIIWERLARPTTYTAKLQPTNVYDFNHTTYPDISENVVRQLNQGDPFVAVGRAKHQLGSIYLMTAEDFGDADESGKPTNYAGVNVVDLNGTPDAPGVAPAAVTGDSGETVTVTTQTPPAAPTEPVAPGTIFTPTPPIDPVKGTNADWRKTFKESIKPLVSTTTVWVKDLEGVLPDIKLEAGKLIPAAGHFWKDGQRFILTIPSQAKGNWYGIPSDVTGPVARNQLKRAEQVIEDIWEKYHQSIEDELDEIFHNGMKYETEVVDGFEELQRSGKLAGIDKVVDNTAKFLFGHSKTKTTK